MSSRPRRQSSRKLVTVIPPESPAARDEGPRLIPLPESGPRHARGLPPLPTDGCVALADKAIRMWSRTSKNEKDAAAGRKTGTD